MKRLFGLTLTPLMAIFVMGQMQREITPNMAFSPEDPPNLPFSTTSFLFQTSSPFPARRSSPKFAFAFAARTTTTVIPIQTTSLQTSLQTTTNRASIRFVSNSPVTNVTEITQIDSDTGKFETEPKSDMKARIEKLPSSTFQPSTTTTQMAIIENRRIFNSTIKPMNRTRSFAEKLGHIIKPQQKLIQPLRPILDNRTTIRPSNKNPVRIVSDNENSNKTKPIHVQTELDPELSELRKRIAAGIAAQKLLRQRLKQTTASRFQTTNIQKVFTPQKFKTSGVSRRKSVNAPKQSGVKTTLADLEAKKRVEGRLRHRIGHIHTGRAGSPSPVIAKRFHSDESVLESKGQVQVAPSTVQMEKFETNAIGSKLRAFSAGPSALVDDEKPTDNLRRTTKFENFHGHRDQPPNSLELQSRPAFCRRCYKFWRNISTVKVNKSAIFQYCCTIGSNKGELFKTLRQTTSIRF